MKPQKVADADWMTIAQAAIMADRSKVAVRRWITEGWITNVWVVPGQYNATWLIDRAEFERKLPDLLAKMATRKGGRGKKESDARGRPRDEAA